MIKPILEEKERRMKALLLTCLEKFSIHVNEKRTGEATLFSCLAKGTTVACWCLVL